MENIIEFLEKRGFVDQTTSSELREHFSTPRKVYIGFDPTADSLHLGNLVGVVALEWFRRSGHTPYVILGGATGRIGDPSGKSMERPLLNDAVLDANVESLRSSFEKLFREPGLKAVLLNNDQWIRNFTLIDFLRDVGKLFRVGQMLAKESVKARLNSEEGLSFTEFSYQILQGYDFAYLNQHHGVTLQMGGSDQWGNITAGIEYNRKIGGVPIFGLTYPLLTRSDGKKFGKSEDGAIWLTAEKLSPYHFYQYLVRVADADVIKLLRMLTFLETEQILALERQMQEAGYVPNTAQKVLAAEVTRFVHGEEGLATALKVTVGISPGSDAKLSGAVLEELIKDMPHSDMNRAEVLGCKIVELFVRTQLVSSRAEAVRLIKNGGVYLNNERVEDQGYVVAPKDFLEGAYLLLSVGKKKRFLVRICK